MQNFRRTYLAIVSSIIVGLLSVELCLAISPPGWSTDLPLPPYALVTYSDGTTVLSPGAGGTFALVGVQASQLVQVTVQYPTNDALQIIELEALDGGAVAPAVLPGTNPNGQAPSPSPNPCQGCIPLNSAPVSSGLLITDTNATLNFVFLPGTSPGSYRITLRKGASLMLLQFWVLDPQNLENNPPAITPADPSNY